MRRLTLALDALLCLRAVTESPDIDVAAAATLAELAAVDAVRLGINDEMNPVTEQDVRETRRVARTFELSMPVSQGMLKLALEAQPDRVLLGLGGRGGLPSLPLDLRGRSPSLGSLVRPLADAGIPVSAIVKPEMEAVKAVYGDGVDGVELYTGGIVDLPAADRQRELEAVGDAVRLASKLRLRVSAGGGLGYRSVRELIQQAPALEFVTVGRAALARAILVGLDRALRDLRASIA